MVPGTGRVLADLKMYTNFFSLFTGMILLVLKNVFKIWTKWGKKFLTQILLLFFKTIVLLNSSSLFLTSYFYHLILSTLLFTYLFTKRVIRMTSGLYSGTYVERLAKVGLTTLEERRCRGDMIQTWKILYDHDDVREETLFTRLSSEAPLRTT